MGNYANVKYKRIINFLRWLENHKGVGVVSGSKHVIAVKIIHNNERFPIPNNHGEVNRFIIQRFQKFLVENNICTKEEFDEQL